MSDAVLEWSTAMCVVQAIFGVALVLPYAIRELRDDWTRLRGQFALGFVTLCIGIAIRMGIGWWYWAVNPGYRDELLRLVAPWIFGANVLIILGMTLCIRLVTIGRYGNWPWVISLVVAGLAALVTF